MTISTPPRHGPRGPYLPHTGAVGAEEAGARKSLAEGRLTLAPRHEGMAEVFLEDGVLTEALILDHDGQPIGVWDAAGLSRWMRGDPPPPTGVLARLRAALSPKR